MLRSTRPSPASCCSAPPFSAFAQHAMLNRNRSQPRQPCAAVRQRGPCAPSESDLQDSRAHQSGGATLWHQRIPVDVVCLLAAVWLTVCSPGCRMRHSLDRCTCPWPEAQKCNACRPEAMSIILVLTDAVNIFVPTTTPDESQHLYIMSCRFLWQACV